MLGETFGHYRIESKLGEGGMGVVYKALDTHLDRPVAVKVLPPAAVADPERRRRFVQEAKAASALNHPNIIHIYDIDEAATAQGPAHYIAMEFVPGKTLDQVIGRKGLDLRPALRYAIQIADALAAAHAAGIVHRDLKPPNVMVSDKDHVKVLDFGLAKLLDPAPAAVDPAGATQTMAQRTEQGVILGTAAYMSPEQAEGRPVDARSDIFSFGAMLYEMVSGRRAFQGETKMSTLVAILHNEPEPISGLIEGAPREMERIIGRCLRKDPARRFQQMDEVKLALEELKEESDSGRLPAASPGVSAPRRRWILPLGIGAMLLLALAAAAVAWRLSRRPESAPGPVLRRLTSDSGLTTDPALSPDGKLVAYASDRGGRNLNLWVQQVAGGDPIQITREEADDREPAFSPDGSQIAFASFRREPGVYVVSTLGGAARKIAADGRRPRFSPDGRWVAYWTGIEVDLSAPGSGRVYVVPVNGGEPRQIQPEFAAARYPVWTPDGNHLLFCGSQRGDSPTDWWVAPLEPGAAVATGVFALLRQQRLSAPPLGTFVPGAWASPGDQVLFSAGLGDSTNLWQIALSPRTWQAADPPQRLTYGAGHEVQPASGARGIVFSSLASNIDLWSLPLAAGQDRPSGDLQRLTEDAGLDILPAFDAAGEKMVFLSSRTGRRNLWMKDLKSGAETALTVNQWVGHRPVFSPDGSRVAYPAAERGKSPTYIVPVGGGAPKKICDDCFSVWDWSPDGKWILHAGAAAGRSNLSVFALEVETGQSTEILAHPDFNLYVPRFSPDGHWLSFAAAPGSAWKAAPFRGATPAPPGEWITAPGWYPLWSADQRFLYSFFPHQGFFCLAAQRVDTQTQRALGEPGFLYHFHSARRSMLNVPIGDFGIAASRNRIAFSLGDLTGNIWMAQSEGHP